MDNDAWAVFYPTQRCRNKGVKFTTSVFLKEIRDSSVTVMDIWNHEENTIDNVNSVVLVTDGRKEPLSSLYTELTGKVRELYIVGDCVAPGRMDMAIFEGHMVGRRI